MADFSPIGLKRDYSSQDLYGYTWPYNTRVLCYEYDR